MRVSRVMTSNPITVRSDESVVEAQQLMRQEKVHRLPVVDRHKKLVGIVSEKDLLYATPSPATTLNVYEIGSLLSSMKVTKAMTKDLIIVSSETPLEEAARLLVDHNIGGLPVVDQGVLVGIVTESDVFKMFIELFGSRSKGIQVTMLIPDEQGELAKVTSAISETGANIISLGTFPGENAQNSLCTLKVSDVSREKLEQVLAPFTERITDIRE